MPRAQFLGVAALLALPFGVASSRASTAPPIVFSADRAPAVTGEIYRLDPNGRRVDLSRSPYQDTVPVVSTDGKRVAFISDRGGSAGVYEVGIDGRHLVTVARRLRVAYQEATLAWQPHGDRLVIGSSVGRVAILQPGRKPIYVRRAQGLAIAQPWSPDGRVLLVWAGDRILAVSPQGHPLWTIGTDQPTDAWSTQGLLVARLYHSAAVYDETGRLRFRISLPGPGIAPSWSPDGSRLAIVYGTKQTKLEVRAADGTVELNMPVRGGPMAWAGDARLVFGGSGRCACRAVGVDVLTGKLSPASSRWLAPFSTDGKLAIVTSRKKPGFSLGVGPTDGGPVKTYGRIAACLSDGSWLPAAASLQFVDGSHSVVYQTGGDCDPPFANLYSVAPDGSDLQRLTNAQAEETQPALSPDDSKIAYSWTEATGLSCKGCSDGIRVATADGIELRTLTDPPDCTFDDSPTWSPDGSTILFSETGCDSAGELHTVPAAGGPVHDLGVAGAEPAWGPSRIAYVGSDQSDSGLWTANPDGSDPVLVAKNGRRPAWSSDGRLAYLAGSDATTVVVGTDPVHLPFASVKSLAWSPDGTSFVVTARTTKTGPLDVYTVKTNGSDPERLTKNYDAVGASWR